MRGGCGAGFGRVCPCSVPSHVARFWPPLRALVPLQVAENEVVQLKKFQKEQEDIKHIKEFIASCGTYANLVKQAKSKQKM